jgi:hypothetical protein
VIITTFRALLRPSYAASRSCFYVSILLCCPPPIYLSVSFSDRNFPTATPPRNHLPWPVYSRFIRYLTPTRVLHARSNLFCISFLTIPHAPPPFTHLWLLFLTSFAMITSRTVYPSMCMLFYPPRPCGMLSFARHSPQPSRVLRTPCVVPTHNPTLHSRSGQNGAVSCCGNRYLVQSQTVLR